MNDEPIKSYYAIIPANVRYDIELPANAKLLYGEITALCNEKGYCWASNSYFAKLYSVEDRTVRRWINSLINKGYIRAEFSYKENSKEVGQRRLYITNNINAEQKEQEERTQMSSPPPDKNVLDNNTLYNNIYTHWLSKDIVKHKKLTSNMEKAMAKVLKEYTEQEICDAIDKYDTVLKDEKYFYSHIFTLEEFLKQKNGLPHFTEEGIRWINYKSSLEANNASKSLYNKPRDKQFKKQTETSDRRLQMGDTEFSEMSTDDVLKYLKEFEK